MPTKLTELVLIYRRERPNCRWDDTAILECEEPTKADPHSDEHAFADSCGGLNQLLAIAATTVIVKADCPRNELVGGLSYRFYGHWVEHERHGRQFQAKTYVRVQPHGKAGVIRYLTTTCAGHGVGQSTAMRLWDKFGGDAVRILREEPEVAAAAVGMPHFTDTKAAAASVVLKEESALEAVHIDLIDLLGGKGFPRDIAKKAVGEWGNKAAELIKRNCFILMRFYGVGFLRCDQLYLEQGGNPNSKKRQALCAWHTIAKDSEGHTWHTPEKCEAGIQARVSGCKVDSLAALKLCKRAKLLSVCRNGDGKVWLAESKKAENEKFVAAWIKEAINETL